DATHEHRHIPSLGHPDGHRHAGRGRGSRGGPRLVARNLVDDEVAASGNQHYRGGEGDPGFPDLRHNDTHSPPRDALMAWYMGGVYVRVTARGSGTSPLLASQGRERL